MTLMKWNPLPELEELRRRMDRLMDESRAQIGNQPPGARTWQPVADVYEDEEQVIIKLELPEVTQELIDVKLEGHTLIVSGERSIEQAEGYQRIEGNYGPFERLFALPPGISEAGIVARCDLGILRIVLPKEPPGKAKQISVETD
jgi:HSP20 family protein